MRTTRILLPMALLVLLAVPARAEDDAADLLRQARAAETVDRDVPRAMDLYRRAFEGGSDRASLDAGLALARLQEERGQNQPALETLARAMERLGARMDDAAKRTVHDAMLRLLPPGARGRSPLGEVVGPPRPAAPSPRGIRARPAGTRPSAPRRPPRA